MEKYVRIKKDDHVDMETELSGLCPKEFQVRVNAFGYPNNYVAYAASILEKTPTILLKARGSAITNLIIASELLRRRHAPLHQISDAGVVHVEDEYEPMEEGLDIVTHARTVPYMQILLSKDELDTTHRGYQAPAENCPMHDEKNQTSKQHGRTRNFSLKTPTQYDAFNTPFVRKYKKWSNVMSTTTSANKTDRTYQAGARREGRDEKGKVSPFPMFKLVPSGSVAEKKGKRHGVQQQSQQIHQRGKGAKSYGKPQRYPSQQYGKGPHGNGYQQQQHDRGQFVKGFGAYQQHGKGMKGSGTNQHHQYQRGKGDGKQMYQRPNGTFSNMQPPTVYRSNPTRPRDPYCPPYRALSLNQNGNQQRFTQQRYRANYSMNNNDNNDARPLGLRQNRAAAVHSPFNMRDNNNSNKNGFNNAKTLNFRHHVPAVPTMRVVGAGHKVNAPYGNNPRSYQAPSVNLRLNIAPFAGGKNVNAYQAPVGYPHQGPRFNHGPPVMTGPHGMRMTYKPLNANDNAARLMAPNTKQQHGRMLY